MSSSSVQGVEGIQETNRNDAESALVQSLIKGTGIGHAGKTGAGRVEPQPLNMQNAAAAAVPAPADRRSNLCAQK